MALGEETSQTLHPLPGWFCRVPCMVHAGSGAKAGEARAGGAVGATVPCHASCTAVLRLAKILGTQEFTITAVPSRFALGLGTVRLRLSSFVAFGTSRAGAHLPSSTPRQHLLGQPVSFPASITSRSLEFWLLWGWLGPCRVLAPCPALPWPALLTWRSRVPGPRHHGPHP